MGRDESVQIIRQAANEHQSLFRRAWHNGEFGKAQQHWKDEQILRREIDRVTSEGRQDIRVA